MAKHVPTAKSSDFPIIADIDAVETDNAKLLIERADALLKAQDDGLRAMEARMNSLFGQSVTLASAAVAATATAFAALSPATGSSAPPTWAVPWVAQSLTILSAFWLAAIAVSAASMFSQTWTASGMQPRDLYSEVLLAAPPNSLRLAVARALQNAIEANSVRTVRYGRRLSAVIALLAIGPLAAATVAAPLARPSLIPWFGSAILLAVNAWLVWLGFPRSER